MPITPLTVFVFALATALATGLGALPFLFFRKMSRTWLAVANSVAAGLMIAASFGLIYEGLAAGLLRVVAGVLLCVAFIAWSTRWLHGHRELELGTLRGTDALRALMIIGVILPSLQLRLRWLRLCTPWSVSHTSS